MTNNVTYGKILQVIDLANRLDLSKDTLLMNKLASNSSKWMTIIDKYKEELYDIELDNCIEKDGIIVKDTQGKFAVNKITAKAIRQATLALQNKEVTLTPNYCPITNNIKTLLGPGIIEMFSGIIFREEDVKDYLENIEKVNVVSEEIKEVVQTEEVRVEEELSAE